MKRLLIRPGGIGDCLACFPAMEWLCTGCTEVWVPSAVVPLVQFADRVQSIASTGIELFGIAGVEPPKALLDRLRTFDEIVTWYGSNRPEFRLEAQRHNINWRFLPALPAAECSQHAIDFFASYAAAPTGLRPKIAIESFTRRKAVVIHPFSGGRAKNWPLSRFREAARALPLTIEWTAGPEEELPEALRFGNLFELARWIRGAALYIGNDSGITHLAAATGVATIGLYGANAAKTWVARGECTTAIIRASVEQIVVSDVVQAAQRLLASK